jgi:transposase-like protein
MGLRGPKSKFNDASCPNKDCECFGKLGQGNIAGNGTYRTSNGRIRKFICRRCGTTFTDRRRTVFFDFKTKDEKVLLALKMMVKGVSMRGVSEIMEVKLDTVRNWAARAAEHREEVNEILRQDMKVSVAELEQLWDRVVNKRPEEHPS